MAAAATWVWWELSRSPQGIPPAPAIRVSRVPQTACNFITPSLPCMEWLPKSQCHVQAWRKIHKGLRCLMAHEVGHPPCQGLPSSSDGYPPDASDGWETGNHGKKFMTCLTSCYAPKLHGSHQSWSLKACLNTKIIRGHRADQLWSCKSESTSWMSHAGY